MSSFILLRKILLLLLAINCCFLPDGYSQVNAKIDSLHNQLQSLPDDSLKVNALVGINRECFRQFELTRMDSYLEELKSVCMRLNHRAGMSNYYNFSGLVSIKRGNYPDALSQFNSAYKIREELHDRKGMADNLSNIGMVYDDQGDYQQAIRYFSQALSMRDESDKRGRAAGYTNLGIIYYKLGDFPSVLSNFLEALHLDEENGDKQDIAYDNNNLALFYEHQENFQEALKYYKVAVSLCQEVGDRECVAGTNLNIGSIHQTLGEYEEALRYYKGSLAIFEEIGLTPEIASTQSSIGNIYLALKDYDSALRYQQSALITATRIGDLPGLAYCHSSLGQLHMARGEYDKSQHAFEEALAIYKESGQIMELRNIYQTLSHLDSLKGDYLSSLAHYKKYIMYKDSISNESSVKTIAEIQTKFETEQKDKEIQMLGSEKEIQRLQLSLHEKTIRQNQIEENKLKVDNLLHLQKAELMDKERQVHLLEIENNKARDLAQQAELVKKESRLSSLNNAAELQQLEIKKQRAVKKYLMGGFVLSALLVFFAYRFYRTRQELRLQTLRNKIARDLHDEVGSTLSSISIFSEIAQQQSTEVIPLLNTIKESSHKMLDAMGDIVWTINPENDQFEKILIRMRNFAFELLGARKIDFEFIADENVSHIQLPMEARKNLYLIFKEAANNMVKYSDANKAYFQIKEEPGFVTMLIRDNGKGFNPHQDSGGNGIKSMKKRAEEIGAWFNIASAPGKGTEIQLKIAV